MRRIASLDRHACHQHGLVSTDQLIADGLSRHQIARLVRTGVLVSMRRGVLRVVGSPQTREQALMASVLAVGEGAFLSHESAAAHWGMWRLHQPSSIAEVTIARVHRPRVTGVIVHRTAVGLGDDVRILNDVPVSSRERTLIDLSDRFSSGQLGRTINTCLRQQTITMASLEACAARFGSGGPRRHLSRVQRVLAERGRGFHPGGSESELGVLNEIRRLDLPEPVQQHRVEIDGHTYYFDYAWPWALVALEWDPFGTHGTEIAHHDDRVRMARATAVGWRLFSVPSRAALPEALRHVALLLTAAAA